MSCHVYDCFRFLTGQPISQISAIAIEPGSTAYLPNDNFIASLQYADGSIGSLTYTALGPKKGITSYPKS